MSDHTNFWKQHILDPFFVTQCITSEPVAALGLIFFICKMGRGGLDDLQGPFRFLNA